MNVTFVLSALSTLAWLLALVVIGLSIVRAATRKTLQGCYRHDRRHSSR